MKSRKKILIVYFIILFLSNYPVTKEIEICRIGGKQHICGKGEDNSGYMDNINVKYYTSCATLQGEDGYSCLCIHITDSGIVHHKFDGYNDLDVQTYNSKYLTYQITPDDPPLALDVFHQCYVGRDCSDITDISLCLSASQCEYINGECRAKCTNHNTLYSCEKDHSCRVDIEKSICTNCSIFPVYELISIIMLILFLI